MIGAIKMSKEPTTPPWILPPWPNTYAVPTITLNDMTDEQIAQLRRDVEQAMRDSDFTVISSSDEGGEWTLEDQAQLQADMDAVASDPTFLPCGRAFDFTASVRMPLKKKDNSTPCD